MFKEPKIQLIVYVSKSDNCTEKCSDDSVVFHVSSFVGIGDLEEDDRMDLDSNVEGHLYQAIQIWSQKKSFLAGKNVFRETFLFFL